MKIKNICIFCGSKLPNQSKYQKLANELGVIFSQKNFNLVYGGAKVGLMGELANAFKRQGRQVIGVIPRQIVDMEVAHEGLDELHIVDGMHQRKELMYNLSELFLALPGGLGTMDELFEVLTWRQLGFHQKKILVLNFDGYYEYLKKLLQRFHSEGFVSQTHIDLIEFVEDLDQLRFGQF
jgi:uncharacterized protein (TIGR00730 family)